MTSTLSQMPVPHRPLPSLEEIKKRLLYIKGNPTKYANDITPLMLQDETGGDCSLSHLRLKKLLEKDEITKPAQWEMVCAEGFIRPCAVLQLRDQC